MISRRHFMLNAAVATAAVPLAGCAGLGRTPAALQWQHFLADERGFSRAPVLLSGQQEAILIDGGFALSDGRAVAAAIQASGKTLSTIYVSQSDPDYYFSLAPIRAAFPQVRVLAASDTLNAIRANVQHKIETWSPLLKDNGPQKLSDIVFPEAYDAASLNLEGHAIDIVTAQDMENRRYLWVPSLQAVMGGVLIVSGLHVWTADNATPASRAAWVKNLEAIAARQPKLVIPGHMSGQGALDISAVHYTREYLLAFEEELARATDSQALIAAMTRRYPNVGGLDSLALGAKVAKGEMKWG